MNNCVDKWGRFVEGSGEKESRFMVKQSNCYVVWLGYEKKRHEDIRKRKKQRCAFLSDENNRVCVLSLLLLSCQTLVEGRKQLSFSWA